MSDNTIGRYLRTHRKQLRLTRPELVERLKSKGHEYSVSTIAWWEDGRTTPPLTDATFTSALAEALEVSVGEMIAGMGVFFNSSDLVEADLSPIERELLDAYRKGDTDKLIRIAARKPPANKK